MKEHIITFFIILILCSNSNAQVPDSMLEFKSYRLNHGMIEFGESFHMSYYFYGNDNMLDSVHRGSYNPDSGDINISECRYYNDKGQLELIAEWQTTYTYKYDSTGKLVLEIKQEEDRTDSIEYLYNTDNQLIYKIRTRYRQGWRPSYRLDKYTYLYSDTLRVTTHYQGYPDYLEFFETFSSWTSIYKSTATFDSLNRKTFEIIEDSGHWAGDKIYTAKYTYNESNKVKNIYYFELTENPDSAYEEIMRVTNYYTEKGNIRLYEKTFFDYKTNTWEIMESKTYYYPGLTTSTTNKSIEIKPDELMVYPNPSSERIYIKRLKISDAQYTIFNVQGIQVKEGVMTGNEINISDLYNGLFIIVIQNDQKTYYGKFIKK